ncbi:MAG: hypothetical protein JO328_01160 [Hyphomicrobiales bacterium]|nr:hypothetical protein [Hyphomicrobiales bacterium]MBV9430081.1 hypothetical protein [Bradyrhizobiaceae bacterium]
MSVLSRRKFVTISVGGASALCFAPAARATEQCVSSGLADFLPNSLTVDCASRRNFQAFRQNPDYLGLVGVINMSLVRGGLGTYQAGNLFLFPWLKPKGQALGPMRTWPAVLPANATLCVNSAPIPNANFALDEYYCRILLKAPWTYFIGFQLDQPYSADDARLAWLTNVDKLADGRGVGICWCGGNLNFAWFAGSSWIPENQTCSGHAWRRLIVTALNQASVGAC